MVDLLFVNLQTYWHSAALELALFNVKASVA